MAVAILKASVRETGEGAYATEIDVDGHVLKGDEPVANGGKNLGPTPDELLLAALGACTTMTVRWYALRNNVPLEAVEVNVTYRRDRVEGAPADIFEKSVHLVGSALTADQRLKLIDVAGKCPVQRLLEGSPVIRTVEA